MPRLARRITGTSPKSYGMYAKAAALGHVESQYAFAIALLNGAGVERNTGVAFALVNIAAAQGHEEATQMRDRLQASLPPDVLRQAQDLSVELFSKYASESSKIPSVQALLQ